MKNFFYAIVSMLITSSMSYAKPGDVESFYFAITGDPQPYRILHSSDSYDTNSRDNKTTWESYVTKGYQNLRQYNPDFLMINGDMTDFGWQIQREDIQSVIKNNSDIKTYYGLGNHDIHNNVNDCHDNADDFLDWIQSSDSCAFHTSNMLRKDIVNTFPQYNPGGYFKHNALGVGDNDKGWGASNAYAFDWGQNLRLIQLNLHPAYEVHLGAPGGAFNVAWTSALPFLEQELKQAQKDNRFVVIGWHEADETNSFDLTKPEENWTDYERQAQKIIK
ncbi:metallophosphoesterase family protein [Photorhabdus temperata]|uniref:metallophosphoesterase family protein n=1 Tax=Photorhabdus temperata TaxID=574560 RepID=UPI000389DF7C|nr:metallophosphoesterase family protein [Photorhabdus temperata]EQB97927.1 phosphoesterase [Photorhabdus temperata subsp. temperata M1021]